MTISDSLFLGRYNRDKPSTAQCSEDNFENIIEILERTPGCQTLSVAIHNAVFIEFASKRSINKKYQALTKHIYDYWKTRRNRPIQPTLKLEDHADNDDDPYVCFRSDDVHQTRARDTQVRDGLRKLRVKLEDRRRLFELHVQKENAKRLRLRIDRSKFEEHSRQRGYLTPSPTENSLYDSFSIPLKELAKCQEKS
jgi:enhancer of polycomb-like protein